MKKFHLRNDHTEWKNRARCGRYAPKSVDRSTWDKLGHEQQCGSCGLAIGVYVKPTDSKLLRAVVSPEMYEWLTRHAMKDGTAVADVVRKFLRRAKAAEP